MAIYSQRRIFLSLRQQFHSYINFNSSISLSSSPSFHSINPNFRSSPLSSTFVLPKFLTTFNFSPLIHNQSFKSRFNGVRSFATRLSESSSNRPPKETIMLEGCDFEHWLVVVEPPDSQLTRDEIIDYYIKTFAQIIGSEEDAKMKIYSVSTRHYFAFSAVISEELSYKLKELPNVRWVLPDSYMDVKNKTYAGEPFINGQAVPYDPKYHEIWVRNREESLRNNNKNRRKQRDPNLRSRSPTSASARGSSNQKWISEPIPQHQAPETSNTENQTSQPSSSSDPGTQQQKWVSPANSQNETAQTSQMHSPSCMQNHAQNQAPPTYFHNQAFQPPHMANHSMPRTPPPTPPQPSATMSTNSQNWGNQSHSWAPSVSSENQACYSSHLQNQTSTPPSTSNTYDPTRNVQIQGWETSLRYQSQPPQPPVRDNNFSYNNTPPSAPANNAPYQGQSRGPISGYQNRSQQPPISINFSHNNVPPSAPSSSTPYQGQSWGPASGYQKQSPQPAILNNFSQDNVPPSAPASSTPYHGQSWGSSSGYQNQSPQPPISNNFSHDNVPPSVSASNAPYQGQSRGPASGYQNRSLQLPVSNNFSHDNGPPSSPASSMSSHMQNMDFYGGNAPSQVQHNGYYRDNRHDVQYRGSSDGYPSQSRQQQQYQDSYNNFRVMENSKSNLNPRSPQIFQNTNAVPSAPTRDMPSQTWNQSSPRWDVPADFQQNGYSRNIPHHVQNGGARTGYPQQNSQYQQYQNSSRDLQRSNAAASPQGWNSQSMTSSIQKQRSVFPDMPTSQEVQSNQSSEGRDMPRPMQNREYQHVDQVTQHVDYTGSGRIPNNSNMEPVRPRDCQERDIPSDDYMYASR